MTPNLLIHNDKPNTTKRKKTMKKLLTLTVGLLIAGSAFAQSDVNVIGGINFQA